MNGNGVGWGEKKVLTNNHHFDKIKIPDNRFPLLRGVMWGLVIEAVMGVIGVGIWMIATGK